MYRWTLITRMLQFVVNSVIYINNRLHWPGPGLLLFWTSLNLSEWSLNAALPIALTFIIILLFDLRNASISGLTIGLETSYEPALSLNYQDLDLSFYSASITDLALKP
jgi:hypothetical protein